MAKEVSNKILIAERITEFSEKDFRTNSNIVHLSEDLLSEKDWNKFAEKALVFTHGRDIFQYAEEYPIVKYQCSPKSPYQLPDCRLNSFVHSITVSTATYGNKFSVDSGKMKSEIADYDTVVYYEDEFGIKRGIFQEDICRFLLKKPKLVVSPEGMLIFFTEREILATVDCCHYCWIGDNSIDMTCRIIKDIEVCNNFCKVTLISMVEKDFEFYYSLKFNFDFSEHQMICPKVEEL